MQTAERREVREAMEPTLIQWKGKDVHLGRVIEVIDLGVTAESYGTLHHASDHHWYVMCEGEVIARSWARTGAYLDAVEGRA